MANQIVKDTDTTINLTLKDAAGLPVNLTNLVGYVVEVYQVNQNLFDQFSKNAQAGYRSVTETDAANGKFDIHLNAANTLIGNVGKEIFYEIKTLAANANFDSGTEGKSTGPISLGLLLDSKTQEQTFS